MLRSFRKLAVRAIFLAMLCLSPPGAAYAQVAPQFQSEQLAQQHCPRDIVVWVNTNSGVYHFKGQRWYGNTIRGAYECRREADAEGDRATRNGQ